MKRFFLIGLALLVAACVEDYKSPWPDALQLLSVNAVYPAGYAHAVHEGAVIRIEEISSGAVYVARTDRRGLAEISVPPGIYRITCSDRAGPAAVPFHGRRSRGQGNLLRRLQQGPAGRHLPE